MDWDKLRVFHAVAEAGSFTHAGDVLNLTLQLHFLLSSESMGN
ncbi:LysR family transcriptional regulator, partial [Acetobacter cerevisiae]